MKFFHHIIIFWICILFIHMHGNSILSQESSGLNLEIEVVSRASLSISTPTQASPIGGNLKVNFGNIDAFGINQNSGVSTEETPLGMAYYQNLTINAGITGSFGKQQNLKVTLLSSNPNSANFFEAAGQRLNPGENPSIIKLGQTKTIVQNISKFSSFNRVLGIIVNPETAAGRFSAEIQYSLESNQ